MLFWFRLAGLKAKVQGISASVTVRYTADKILVIVDGHADPFIMSNNERDGDSATSEFWCERFYLQAEGA